MLIFCWCLWLNVAGPGWLWLGGLAASAGLGWIGSGWLVGLALAGMAMAGLALAGLVGWLALAGSD